MALTTKEICKRYCDSKWQTSRNFYEYNVAKKEFDDWLEELYKEIKAETMKEFYAEAIERFHPTNPKQKMGLIRYEPGCLLHGSSCEEWATAIEYRKAAGA